MKKYSVLIKENMKQHKGSYIGIFILTFIISITLSCVLSVYTNAGKYEENEMDRLSFGDLVYWMLVTENHDQIISQMEAVEGVSKVFDQKYIAMDMILNEKKSGTNVYAYTYDKANVAFRLVNENYDYIPYKELSLNEVYVPISFASIYNAKVNDVISLTDDGYDLVIKGFFEDPIDGSTMMGIKSILISEDYFQEFENCIQKKEASAEMGGIYEGRSVHVFLAKDCKLSAKRMQQKINTEVNLQGTNAYSYTRESFQGFMLMIENIFIGFLLAFAAVLLLVSMIVISHSIKTNIEQSYVDLGILKALGYQTRDLMHMQCMQFLYVLLAGVILGMISSTFLVRIVNHIIVSVTGIKIPATLPMPQLLFCFGVILLVIFLFMLLQLSFIGKISPIKAIRGGISDVYFASRLTTGLYKKGLQFFLALRQITTGKKRYLGACLISALLVFFLTFCMRIYGWLGENGEGLKNTMGSAAVNGRTYDFGVCFFDESIKDEVEEMIDSNSPITFSYKSIQVNAQVEGLNYLCNVVEFPEYYHILEGRTCRYDNEIVVTKKVANELSVWIGDSVELVIDGVKKDFLITGINQCANDMGDNISMSLKGYETFGIEGNDFYYDYFIKDPSVKDTLMDQLKSTYEGKLLLDINYWSGVDGILQAANAMKVMMYVICGIFNFVVVYLTGSKIILKERHDLSVYQTLGFRGSFLQISFALRFVIIAFVGAFFGCVLSNLLTDPIAGSLFSMMGADRFASVANVGGMILSVVFVCGTFFLFAYWLGGHKTSGIHSLQES